MKPLRTRLQEARKRLGIPWEGLERDYLLSWILAGIGQVDSLRETLVFKGGTALKKCYFGDYRFSEDLDFSGLEGVPTGEAMERAVREACRAASSLLDEYAPVEIVCERYSERDPHPGGQESFTIRARFPWHRRLQTRAMIETAVDERVLEPARRRRIIHEYGEPLEAEIRVYALEEVVAEKLRAILQHAKRLEERGWSRSRARDYYDLWRVLGEYRERMALGRFGSLLREKCAVRRVTYAGALGSVRRNGAEALAGTGQGQGHRPCGQGQGREIPSAMRAQVGDSIGDSLGLRTRREQARTTDSGGGSTEGPDPGPRASPAGASGRRVTAVVKPSVIPEALAKEAVDKLRQTLHKLGRRDLASSLLIEAKRGFLYVAEGDGKSVCRLRFTGKVDDWDLQMFKWSSERYDTGGDFMFGGGTLEECISAAIGGYRL